MGGKRRAERGQVRASRADQFCQGIRGQRAELKLPARLYRERGTRRKRRKLIPNGLWCLSWVAFIVRMAKAGQGSGYLFRLDWERGIAAIAH